MKLFEMQGFLSGKCLPGDMRVNETNAEYLVRKFAEKDEQVRLLTEQRDAVVADIEEMKSVIAENWNMRDVLRQFLKGRPGGVYFNKWEPVIIKALNELPATSAILDSLRAEGVEKFAKHLRANDSDKSVCKMFALGAEEFARQLRESKGAQS